MRNPFEEDIYRQLVRKFGKANVEYEPCKYRYVVAASYTPDFRVKLLDGGGCQHGGEFLVESKGYFRREDMRKLRSVKECNPELDLRLIFQHDKQYTKTMSYTDWADKYGFPSSVANISGIL